MLAREAQTVRIICSMELYSLSYQLLGASEYFQRTENIAGVKDMRFQALMPDVLHWLGITKIDRMLSMSK